MIVLASRSAARRTMLAQAGLDFQAMDAGVDEGAIKTRMLADAATPLKIALALAEAKALAAHASPRALVIGSDQVLELDGALIDKAETLDIAAERLWTMRGRAHRLHAAVALVQDGAVVWRGADTAQLWMRAFSRQFLDDYLACEGEAVLSSVGCYRLEGLGAQLFDRIEGDYFTVLGMPLWPLLDALRTRGEIAR